MNATTQEPYAAFGAETPYYSVTHPHAGRVSPYFASADDAIQWRQDKQVEYDAPLDCWKHMHFHK